MKILLFLSLIAVTSVSGYHILCIQKVPTKSHYNLLKGFVSPLLRAGHEVTFITQFPDPKPIANLTYIDVSHTIQILDDLFSGDPKASMSLNAVLEFGRKLTEGLLEAPAVQDILIKKNFDAVVTEFFFSDVDAGFAAIAQAPWILLGGTLYEPHYEYLVDTVRSITVVPSSLSTRTIPMNLWGRVQNTVGHVVISLFKWLYYPAQEATYVKCFGPLAAAKRLPLPSFDEAHRNVSILFVNSHPSFAPVHIVPPNVIDIAGFHISPTVPPLPSDLQNLLNSSKDGVIYFSMGSVVKSSQMSQELRRELLDMFGKLSQTVLWKFEEEMPDLPKNVHVRSWMPQASILAHPNVKVFITHGGLLSTLEALQYGVPLLAVPVFGDQPANAHRSVVAGYALQVPFATDMAPKLESTLKEMLSNDKYYNKAKYLSQLFRKRPVHPSELITNYIEIAIESKGAYHLRSPVYHYKWYEIWMLDALAVLIIILYIVYYILKSLIKAIKSKYSKKSKSKKNK